MVRKFALLEAIASANYRDFFRQKAQKTANFAEIDLNYFFRCVIR